jgi:hypothetical protein
MLLERQHLSCGFNRWMQYTKDFVRRASVAMKQRARIYYTDSQKAVMWERWRKGDSLQQIAQLFVRNHSSIQGILAETGGITGHYCESEYVRYRTETINVLTYSSP